MARKIAPMARLARLVIAAALTVTGPAFSAAIALITLITLIAEPAAFADDGGDVAVGTSLQATEDVTLHRAEIIRGSRVSVTKLVLRSGRLDGVRVALADGHVVTMSLAQMHRSFRVVHD